MRRPLHWDRMAMELITNPACDVLPVAPLDGKLTSVSWMVTSFAQLIYGSYFTLILTSKDTGTWVLSIWFSILVVSMSVIVFGFFQFVKVAES